MAKNFDFKSVFLTVNGLLVQGFVDGDGIVVARNRDDWELTVGNDGEATRSKQNDKSGRITIRLNQSSASNDIFNGLRLLDEASGLGQVPIMLKDLFGSTLVFAAQAWLVKVSDLTFGRSVSQREYIFETGNLEMTVGGNL